MKRLIILLFLLCACESGGTATVEEVQKKYNDGTYEYETDGEYGTMNVQIVIEDDVISSITILSHHDTKAIIQDVEDIYIANILSAQSSDVDMVSGATGSCQGVKDAVDKCLEEAAIVYEED